MIGTYDDINQRKIFPLLMIVEEVGDLIEVRLYNILSQDRKWQVHHPKRNFLFIGTYIIDKNTVTKMM